MILKVPLKWLFYQVDCPTSWTPSMDSFYNEVDSKLLDIELEDVLGKMNGNPKHWGVDR